MSLTEKGQEILNCIATDGPCSQYYLREKKKRWSSRTVWKQIHRFEEEGLIHRSASGYELTDHGFYVLISVTAFTSASEARILLTKAATKYPEGETQKTLSWMLKPRPKRNMEKILIEDVRKPNLFVICRTDMDGRIVWLFQMGHALDRETGRFNLRVLKRVGSKRRPRWRIINLR
jgi:biotin operon repressor